MAAHDYFDQKYADMGIHYTCLIFIGQDKMYYIFNKKIKIGKTRSSEAYFYILVCWCGVLSHDNEENAYCLDNATLYTCIISEEIIVDG
jgi:hypothetical protein